MEMDDCIICLDRFVIITMKKTICDHLFCNECYIKWFTDNDSCPLCRQVITINIENNDDQLTCIDVIKSCAFIILLFIFIIIINIIILYFFSIIKK